jgi:hypothetical protein
MPPMRELTVNVLILDDESVWIRQGGVMRQVPNLTYEDLEDVTASTIRPQRRATKARQPRRSESSRAKKEKSGGGGHGKPGRKPRRGGREVDWADGRKRYEHGATANDVAAALGVSSAAVYQHAKGEGWKKPGASRSAPVKDVADAPRRRAPKDPDAGRVPGRLYCKECGQTSPAGSPRCINCGEVFPG